MRYNKPYRVSRWEYKYMPGIKNALCWAGIVLGACAIVGFILWLGQVLIEKGIYIR